MGVLRQHTQDKESEDTKLAMPCDNGHRDGLSTQVSKTEQHLADLTSLMTVSVAAGEPHAGTLQLAGASDADALGGAELAAPNTEVALGAVAVGAAASSNVPAAVQEFKSINFLQSGQSKPVSAEGECLDGIRSDGALAAL